MRFTEDFLRGKAAETGAVFTIGKYRFSWKKAPSGIGVLTTEHPSFALPYHQVCADGDAIRRTAEATAKTFEDGKTPNEGLFRRTELPAMHKGAAGGIPMRKAISPYSTWAAQAHDEGIFLDGPDGPKLPEEWRRPGKVVVGPPPCPNRPEYPYVGSVVYQGMLVLIENEKGSVREGPPGPDGKPTWRTRMCCHYGEFADTIGTDGDPIDVFVGSDATAPMAYVVHQKIPGTEKHDEDKVMLGFRTAADAEEAYRKHYDKGGFFGGLTPWSVSELRAYLQSGEADGQRLDSPSRVRGLLKGSAVGEVEGATRPRMTMNLHALLHLLQKARRIDPNQMGLFGFGGSVAPAPAEPKKVQVEEHQRTVDGKTVQVPTHERVVPPRPPDPEAPRKRATWYAHNRINKLKSSISTVQTPEHLHGMHKKLDTLHAYATKWGMGAETHGRLAAARTVLHAHAAQQGIQPKAPPPRVPPKKAEPQSRPGFLPPPGEGWMPVVGSKHGGYHKNKPGGGYAYWYPGEGETEGKGEDRQAVEPAPVPAIADEYETKDRNSEIEKVLEAQGLRPYSFGPPVGNTTAMEQVEIGNSGLVSYYKIGNTTLQSTVDSGNRKNRWWMKPSDAGKSAIELATNQNRTLADIRNHLQRYAGSEFHHTLIAEVESHPDAPHVKAYLDLNDTATQSEEPALEDVAGDDYTKDIPADLARRAWAGISHSPERRGERAISDYAGHLTRAKIYFESEAKTPEAKAQVPGLFKEYRDGYRKHYAAWLAAQSRLMSPMITGPARFPVDRMRKIGDTADARNRELQEWSSRAQARIVKTITTKPKTAEEIASAASAKQTHSFDGGQIVYNPGEERLQVLFDDKPDAEMRAKLKGAGFVFSFKNTAWQRKLTDNAVYSTRRLLDGAQDIPLWSTSAKVQPAANEEAAPEPTPAAPPAADKTHQQYQKRIDAVKALLDKPAGMSAVDHQLALSRAMADLESEGWKKSRPPEMKDEAAAMTQRGKSTLDGYSKPAAAAPAAPVSNDDNEVGDFKNAPGYHFDEQKHRWVKDEEASAPTDPEARPTPKPTGFEVETRAGNVNGRPTTSARVVDMQARFIGRWSDPWEDAATATRQARRLAADTGYKLPAEEPAPAAPAATPAPAPAAKPPEAAQEYRYGAQNRPPGFGATPAGHKRIDPPVPGNRKTRHGVVVYDRPLSDEEMYRYELAKHATADEAADAIVRHIPDDYRQDYADIVRTDGPDALQSIAQDARINGPGSKADHYTHESDEVVLARAAQKLLDVYPAPAATPAPAAPAAPVSNEDDNEVGDFKNAPGYHFDKAKHRWVKDEEAAEASTEILEPVLEVEEPDDAPASDTERKGSGSRRQHVDVGEKIGGARKDKWERVDRHNLGALEAEGDAAAFKHVTKQKVLGEHDPQADRDAGNTAGCSMMKAALYSAIASKPNIPTTEDLGEILRDMMGYGSFAAAKDVAALVNAMTPEKWRAAYVSVCSKIQKGLDECSTWENVYSFLGELREPLDKGGAYSEQVPITKEVAADLTRRFPARPGNWTAFRSREDGADHKIDPLQLNNAGLQIVSRRSPLDHNKHDYYLRTPVKDPAERWAPAIEAMVLGKRFYDSALHIKGAFAKQSYEAKNRADDDWSWSDAATKSGGDAAKRNAFVWTRRHTEPKRLGGPAIPETINGEMLSDTFGLRAVEYGNWVNDEDAGKHLALAYGALTDLADLVGIDPKQLSHSKTLALAFGARGSGRANAHYEPDRKVINLTHTRGGGTLAHEWAHFLDNVVAGGGIRTAGTKRRAMHGSDGEAEHPQVQAAFAACKKAMMEADPSTKPDRTELARAAQKLNIQRLMARTPEQKTAYNKAAEDHNYKVKTQNLSKFAADAAHLGSYWSSNHEMFARCFEAWAQDKLGASGRENTYLVTGTGAYGTVKDGRPVEAYPQGAERERINAAIDRLVATLRTTGALQKALGIPTLAHQIPALQRLLRSAP